VSEQAGLSHKVAWADRVEYDKIWFRNIQQCDETFGTPLYEKSVWRLYYSIINIKDGPQLHDIINDWLKGTWYPKVDADLKQWKVANPFEATDENNLDHERQEIMTENLPDFCFFMRQLLNDHGYAFYQRSGDSMEDKMY